MHGYEMITELEERTGGRWRPSAGSIYPTLQLLEDEGLVTAEEVEGRKVYSLTDAGQKAVPERTEGQRPWEEGDEDSPRFEARKELFRLIGAAKQLARADDDEQLTKAAEILKDARRKLYEHPRRGVVSRLIGGRDRSRPPSARCAGRGRRQPG